MDYRRFGDPQVVRLDPGEEICQALEDQARREGIALAEINGLGAVDDFTAVNYDSRTGDFIHNRFREPMEIVSLHGTLTGSADAPHLHLHMSAADIRGHVVGGHLKRAFISVTAEIVVRVIHGQVTRRPTKLAGVMELDL